LASCFIRLQDFVRRHSKPLFLQTKTQNQLSPKETGGFSLPREPN